jgi:HlyD family secretion protein
MQRRCASMAIDAPAFALRATAGKPVVRAARYGVWLRSPCCLQVAQRRVDLADTVVRAPFTGVAISKDAHAGEMVSPVSAGGGFTRTGISTIVDMSSLEIEVDVNEANINRVSPGQPVTAVLDAYPEWRIPARVITTVPAADRQKASMQVRIAFDQIEPGILPDMGVKVSFLHQPTAGQGAPPATNHSRVQGAPVR